MTNNRSAEHKSICIFCGATDGVAAEYVTAATTLVSSIVRRGHTIVYGGGRTGLMGVVAKAALALGGTVIGVISEFLVDREVALSGLTQLEVTANISERKRRMAELSDGFVALPGGLGTLEEFTEVLSAAQLGLHTKPCALLNLDGYFDHLIGFVDHAAACGFVSPAGRNLLIAESDPERLVARLSEEVTPGRSDRPAGKFAAH